MIRSDSGLIFFLSPVASVIALSATAKEINRAPPPLLRSSAESSSATGRRVGVEWEGSLGSARGILNASLCAGFTALKEESGGWGRGEEKGDYVTSRGKRVPDTVSGSYTKCPRHFF